MYDILFVLTNKACLETVDRGGYQLTTVGGLYRNETGSDKAGQKEDLHLFWMEEQERQEVTGVCSHCFTDISGSYSGI